MKRRLLIKAAILALCAATVLGMAACTSTDEEDAAEDPAQTTA